MDLKICIKKLFRTPVKTFLFFLLLTVTGALLSLCFSMLMTARETNRKAQETFTTIAVPNFEKIKHDSVDRSKNLNDLKEEDFIKAVEDMNKLYYKVLEQANITKIGKVDLRKSYLAYSDDIIPLAVSAQSRKTWNEWSICYNMAVFELEATGTRTIKFDSSIKKRNPEIDDIVVIEWKINNIYATHPGYRALSGIETYTTASEMRKRGAFEIGKRYLMAGHIKNFHLEPQDGPVYEGKYPDRIAFFIEDSASNLIFDKNMKSIPNKSFEGYFKSYIEIKGDTDDFLDSSEGAKYKELIENINKLDRTANVIGIDNINAIAHFNQKDAFVVTGREINSEEYNQGENVCLVSWYFAYLNNLNIGDELNLSLTNAEYEYALTSNGLMSPLNRIASVKLYHSQSYSIEGEGLWLMSANPYSMPSFKEHTYKIVGIYQSPMLEVSEFMLSYNTIYVPSKSVDLSTIEQSDDNKDVLEQIPSSLYSIVIPNDRLDEFKAELQEIGIDKYFLYYDQGYSMVKSVLKVLMQNASIILLIGIVIWTLVLILFILLYIIKEKKVAGIMRSLGISVRRTFAHLIISCMLLALPSTMLGGVVSSAMEDSVVDYSYNMAIDQVMKSSFDQSFSVNVDTSYNVLNEQNDSNKGLLSSNLGLYILLIGFVQFAIIICLSSVFIFVMLRKNPMELVRSKE
jgi:cell division protein FtsX